MGKKVFLGGLSWSSTPALDFEVEKAVIMCDKQTGKSRGFGFIVFADSCTKELQSHYEVEGRLVEVKTALRKHEIIAPVKQHTKIFVGGIPQEVTWEELLAYFSQFGEVIGGQIMIDKKTKRSRGFGFVKFLHEESVVLAFSIEHYIHFKKIEIKIAESNPKKLQKNSIENSFENSESATSFEAEGSDSVYERTWVNPSMALGATKKLPPTRIMPIPPRDESGSSTTGSSRSSVRSTSSGHLEALHETAVSRSQASESHSEYGRSDDGSGDESNESEEILRFSKGYGPTGHKNNFKMQPVNSYAKPNAPYPLPLLPASRMSSASSPQPTSRSNVPNRAPLNMTSSSANIEMPFGRFVNPVFNAQLYGHNFPQQLQQPQQPQYGQQNFQNYSQPQNAPYGQNFQNSNFNINSPRNMTPNLNPNVNPNYGSYSNGNYNPNYPSNYNPSFDQAKSNRAQPQPAHNGFPIGGDNHISNHDLDFMLFMQDYKIEATPREISLNTELSQSFAPEHYSSSTPESSPQQQHKETHHKERSSTISNPKSLRKFLSTSTSKIAFSKSSISSASGGEDSPTINFVVLLFSAFSDKKIVVSVKREQYSMPIRDFVEHAASKENLDLRNNWTIVGTYGPIVQDNLGLKLVIKPSDNHPLLKPFSALSVSGGVPFKDRSSHEHEPTSDQFANQHNSLFGSGTLMTQLNWNSESFAPTEQDKLKQGTPVFNLHKHARS